jgi:hypothetical protein
MINANENSGLQSRLLKLIAKEYHWPDFPAFATPKQRPVVNLDAKTLAAYAGYYDYAHNVLSLVETEGRLIAKMGGGILDEFLPESNTTFYLPDVALEVSFEKNARGEAIGLKSKSNDGERKVPRIGPLIHALKTQPDPDAALTRRIESALKAFAQGGKAVDEATGITPGARRDFAPGLRDLAGIKTLNFIAAQDVADRQIERHDSRVSRILYYQLVSEGAPRPILIYLTADGLVTDEDIVAD